MANMSVSADALRTHIDYMAWANRRILDAASQLSPEELTRDFQTADRSVLDTMAHVFAGDRVWLARLEGGPVPGFISDRDRNLEVLQVEWPALGERWQRWAQGITDESAQAMVSYTDLKGRPWTQPLWQLILHVVNHGTHHRGQVAGFLRTMGHLPPVLDLVAYYRQLGAAAAQA